MLHFGFRELNVERELSEFRNDISGPGKDLGQNTFQYFHSATKPGARYHLPRKRLGAKYILVLPFSDETRDKVSSAS